MSTAFRISLDGAQQVPVVATAATGLGTAVFDSVANTLSYEIDIFGLDWGPFTGTAPETPNTLDDVNNAHFHNAARGVNGGVVLDWKAQDDDYVPFVQVGSGFTTVTGLWETTDAGGSLNSFLATLAGATLGADVPLYANVHTAGNSNGEIRGQLVTIATDNGELVEGTAGAEFLPGLGGDDTIDPKTRPLTGFGDRVDGGGGTDTLVVNAAAETQRVELKFSGPDSGSVASLSDNFVVDFTSIEKVNFTGGSGNDDFDTRSSSLAGGTIDGGAGIDRWQADFSANSSDISFALGTSTSIAPLGITSILGIEKINMTTGNGNDTIGGGVLSDTIATGGGNDTIDPKTTSNDGDFDDVNGGDGTDTLAIDASAETQSVTMSFSGVAPFTQGQVNSASQNIRVIFSNIEKVNFTGGSGDDFIDMLILAPAGGILNGGGGIDFLRIDLTSIAAGIVFSLGQTTSLLAAGLTSIVDVERIDISTGNGNDTIAGGAQDDTIKTGGGDDTVNAGSHPVGGFFDSLDGEGGNDTLVVGASAETQGVTVAVNEASHLFTVTSASDNIGVSAFNFEMLNFTGGSGDDMVSGRTGDDILNGGRGIDTAVFAGTLASSTITRDGATVTVAGPNGSDELVGFERVQFQDATFDIGPVSNDFNGDGMSDVLFSNIGAIFGSNYEWQLNNRSLLAEGAIDLFDKNFDVQAIGDFDRDGNSDVLFQNPDTGGVWQWKLDGTSIASQGAVDVGDPGFHLLGTGDFNGDFRDDVLFRNDAGFVYQWQMNGFVNTPLPVGPLDPSWHVQGAGDFNGDGKDDILLRNLSAVPNENGAFFLWQMNGNLIAAEGGIERPPVEWHTLGIGDFNGDGKDDYAVRNESATPDNGAVWIYLMDGTTIVSQGAAGIANPTNWRLQLIGDLDGDGKDDILFRNDAGFFYSWNMNGTTIASEGLLQGAAQWADPSFNVVTPLWDAV